jgi:methyl-accepting chemotaxis protein
MKGIFNLFVVSRRKFFCGEIEVMGILDRLSRSTPAIDPVWAALSAAQPAAMFDAAGVLVEANATFATMFGFGLAEMSGSRFDQLFGNHVSGGAVTAATPWTGTGNLPEVGTRRQARRKSAEVFVVELTGIPVKKPDGSTNGLVVLVRDATKEEDWHALYRGRNEAIKRTTLVAEFDLNGVLTWANDLYLKLNGVTLEEVKGQHHRIFVEPNEAASPAYAAFWADLRAGKAQTGTFRRRTPKGKAVWIEATHTPICDSRGVPQSIMKVALDITDAKMTALNNEARNAAMLRSSAIIEFTPDGMVVDANDNFLNVMGYRLDEIRGRHHRIFCSTEESSSPDYVAFWAKLNRGEFDAREYRRIAKDGHDVWIAASYNPVFGPDGKVAKVVKFATDISGRKRATDILKDVLSTLASGDLTARITEQLTPEFDGLRIDFNAAADALSTLLSDIVERTGSTLAKIGEIAQSADSLSRRTEQQAATLEETAAAMQEMSTSVKSSSGAADEASRLVEASRSRTEAGAGVVRDAVRAMEELAQKSEQISRITSVIDEIAFQTNLLALNAGVEAARAGDAGRGFAVVASEVRALAQRSSDAAREIADLISASSAQVSRCVTLVSQGGSALDEIESSVHEIAGRIVEIASSAREQSAGFAEINVAIGQLDTFTQQNAAMFEETTAATRLLTSEMTALSEATESFRTEPANPTGAYRAGGTGWRAPAQARAS